MKDELEQYAKVSWNIEDIFTLRPDWTEEQADEFLERASDRIQDRMIEAGWAALDYILATEGL